MRNLSFIALLAAVTGSAGAQASPTSIDPGMTREQVIARLGKPVSEHTSGRSTYLFYRNGQERKMGMSDFVALDEGKVVDAVFRSSERRYTGRSSSPAPIPAAAAIAKGNGGRAPVKKAAPPAKTPAPPVKKAAPPAKTPAPTKKPTPAPAKKP